MIKNKVVAVNNSRRDDLEELKMLTDGGWIIKYPPTVAKQSTKSYATMVYFILEKEVK